MITGPLSKLGGAEAPVEIGRERETSARRAQSWSAQSSIFKRQYLERHDMVEDTTSGA